MNTILRTLFARTTWHTEQMESTRKEIDVLEERMKEIDRWMEDMRKTTFDQGE